MEVDKEPRRNSTSVSSSVGGDDDTRSDRQRGCLLEVSNFLTQFQSHLLPASVTVGVISPDDLEKALQYRKVLKKFHMAKDSKFVLQQYGRDDPDLAVLADNMARLGENHRVALEDYLSQATKRTRQIHFLLQRLEVYATKLVTQDFLVAPRKLFDASSASLSPSKKSLPSSPRGSCCHCCLLNLPCSKYLASIVPLIQLSDEEKQILSPRNSSGEDSQAAENAVDCCSMALPPNKYTFSAYARFALVVSVYLESNISEDRLEIYSEREQQEKLFRKLLTSPACEHKLNKSRKHSHGKNPIYTDDYEWQPEDIMALWMRAQRNTRSMRHLRMLWEVQREEEQQEKITLRAIFRGNPNLVDIRVQETSDAVDELVSWAVINQSMFTFPRIKQQILREVLEQNATRKRPRAETEQQQPSQATTKKRIRWDETAAITRDPEARREQIEELLEASRRFVLRWFARRNRRVLAPLLSDAMYAHPGLDIGERVSSVMWKDFSRLQTNSLLFELRQYFEELMSKEGKVGKVWMEDNTFEKVDRKLDIRGRYHFDVASRVGDEQAPVSSREQVLALCDALEKAWPNKPQLVKEAKQDFIRMYDHFFPPDKPFNGGDEDDVYQLATSLIDPGSGVVTQVIDMLNNTPSPWDHTCVACKKSDESPLKSCVNCERIFHHECGSTGTIVSLGDILQKSDLFKGLIKLQQPSASVCRPDFSTESTIQWTEMTITIKREVLVDGKAKVQVRPLQLSITSTEECEQAFEALDSNSATLLTLKRLIKSKKEGEKRGQLRAAKFPHIGSLIYAANAAAPGYRSGLRVGDIITQVKCVSCATPENQSKHGGNKYDLSKVVPNDRKKILSIPATEWKFTIVRPNKDVMKTMDDYMSAMKQMNRKMLFDILRDESDMLWVCESCSTSTRETAQDLPNTLKEAQFCRAVVRRLGMEAYARPFLECDHLDKPKLWSLRRLDSMLTHIMQKSSDNISLSLAPGPYFEPPRPDCTSGRDPIPWAKALEDRPAELLCKAMEVLLSSSVSENEDWEIQQCGILRHFFACFAVWCVGGTARVDGFSTIGPPGCFRYVGAPWIESTCTVCFSRGCHESSATCDDAQCVRFAACDAPSLVDIGVEGYKEAMEAVVKYSNLGSIVGTSFWVLPDDPLVRNVEKVVPIDHANRPVEFIVASYLPANFREQILSVRPEDEYDRILDGEGFYHLLPIVTSHQLRFLLDRCKLRTNDGGNAYQWARLDVLNLEGVARYSPAALREKVKVSMAISTAIHQAIAQNIFKSPTISTDHIACMLESKIGKEELEMPTLLLDAMLKGTFASKLMRNLFPKWNHEVDETEHACQSNGLDIMKPFPGRVPLNPTLSSDFQIFPLKQFGPVQCQLFYSDILYRGEGEKKILDSMVDPPILSPCPTVSSQVAPKAFTLTPPAPRGWGFEIVRWQNAPAICRIGRIIRNSPAFKAGLRTHDIIIAVNGLKTKFFSSHSEFLTTVRGLPMIKVLKQGRVDEKKIGSVMSTLQMLDPKSTIPVRLTILRPEALKNGSATSLDGQQFPFQKGVAAKMTDNAPSTSRQSVPDKRTAGSSTRRAPSHEIVDLTNGDDDPTIRHHTPARQQPLAAQQLPSPVGALNRSISTNNYGIALAAEPRMPIQYHQGNPLRTFERMQQPNVPLHPQVQHNARQDLKCLLKQTCTSRPPMNAADFYRAAGHGTVLTALEVAVFFHAVSGGYWKYGIRLLMPRYDWKMLVHQIKLISNHWGFREVSSIPLFDETCYKVIVDLDSKRMNCLEFPEIGDFVLKELVRGQEFQYRLPVKPLPIDRNIEKWYEKRDKEKQNLSKAIQIIRQHQQKSVNSRSITNQPLRDSEHISLQHSHHQSQYNSLQHSQRQLVYDQPQVQHDGQIIYQVGGDVNPNDHLTVNNPNGYYHTTQHERGHQMINGHSSQGPPQDNLLYNSLPQQGEDVSSNTNAEVALDRIRQLPNNTAQRSFDQDLAHSRQANQGEIEEFGLSFHAYQQIDSGDVPPERIRGGGENNGNIETQRDTFCEVAESQLTGEPNEIPCLADVPPHEWDCRPVFAVVETDANDGSTSEAMLVGFVKLGGEISDSQLSAPETVNVEAYYLSNVGYFESCRVHTFDVDELYLIGDDPTTEEAKVLAKLRSRNIDPALRRLGNKNSEPLARDSLAERSEAPQIRPASRKEGHLTTGTSIDLVPANHATNDHPQTSTIVSENMPRSSDLEAFENGSASEPSTSTSKECRALAERSSNEKAIEGTLQDDHLGNTELIYRVDHHDMQDGGTEAESSSHRATADEEHPLKLVATNFLKRLGHVQILGALPDGRTVYWLSNDHRAIYIQETLNSSARAKAQKDYFRCLQQAQSIDGNPYSVLQTPNSGWCCAWGCSVAVSNAHQALPFPSLNELQHHYDTVHNFGEVVKNCFLRHSGKFRRITEGKIIVELARGLSSAIVARFPLLEKEATTSGSASHDHFFASPTGHVLSFPVNQKVLTILQESVCSRNLCAKNLQNLVDLWTRLSCLYECDTTGCFRLADDDFYRTFFQSKAREIPMCGMEPSVAVSAYSCEGSHTRANSKCVDNGQCSLCSLPFENYLSVQADKNGENGSKEDQTTLKLGIGCTLLSHAARIGKPYEWENSGESAGYKPSRLGDAKVMLLHVATVVPESIRLTEGNAETTPGMNPLKGFRVFDSERNYSLWKSFVLQIVDTRMLAQAFVALVTSINHSEFPSWWADKTSGWSTSQFLMTESNLSALHLHIYALDAALTDMIMSSLHLPPSFNIKACRSRQISFKDLNQQQIMDKYWSKALLSGLSNIDGTHDSMCCVCDGTMGDLLQCNLCHNVQHRKCTVVLARTDNTELTHFLCDSCLRDIDDFEMNPEFVDVVDDDEEDEDKKKKAQELVTTYLAKMKK